MPRVLEVIESEVPRGQGINSDPCRIVKQYHTKEGDLLAERDEWRESQPFATPNNKEGSK